MKKMLCMLLAMLLLLTGCTAGTDGGNYKPLDKDPAEAITFDGKVVTWAGQSFTLDENTFFLDCRLEESAVAENPYAFREIRAALSALKDGTADKPMTLLIAPGVYWLKNFGTEGGTDSLYCAAQAIHVDCEYLKLYGLSHQAKNVVVGLEHRELKTNNCGSNGFSMFIVQGQGLRCENLTIGSYETHTLDYALAPEMGRARQVADFGLQQMLFCTGDDGVAVNCCFEGRMSLNHFAEYYRNCSMLVGCRVETGACIDCTFELNDGRLGGADLFGCEVLMDPIVKGQAEYPDGNLVYGYVDPLTYDDLPEEEKKGTLAYYCYIVKYAEEMYVHPGEELDYNTLNGGLYSRYPIRIDCYELEWDMLREVEDLFPLLELLRVQAEAEQYRKVNYLIMLGECAEMGLEPEILSDWYVDAETQEQFDRRIQALEEEIEKAKNPAVKKMKQKKIDQCLAQMEESKVIDVIVPVEVRTADRTVPMDWDKAQEIMAWEEKNPGRRILLPLLDDELANGRWFQVDWKNEPLFDEAGNLLDAYCRDENGDVIRFSEDDFYARVNRYNYFLYRYGIAPDVVFGQLAEMRAGDEYHEQYVVDTDIVTGEVLRAMELEANISYWSIGWANMHYMDLRVDGETYDLRSTNPTNHRVQGVPDAQANAVRVLTGDGVVYNLPNLYGEDPFNEAELIRQAAIANGEAADAYLNIPLVIPEE